ncbi:unnamed protein product [Lampetra planeri]
MTLPLDAARGPGEPSPTTNICVPTAAINVVAAACVCRVRALRRLGGDRPDNYRRVSRSDQNQHERVHDKQLCRVRRVAGVGPPESLKVKMSGAACGVFGLCTTHMKGAGLARGAAVSDGSADQRVRLSDHAKDAP